MRSRTGSLLLFAVAATVVFSGQSPVMVSYVTSGSMEPTIGVDEGYLVVPAIDVQPGDVVVFESATRGELVTHRIVAERPRGFVTKGDANLATDQATGHPLVTPDHVTGQVLQLGGTLVVVPGVGHAVRFIRGHAEAIASVFGLVLVGMVISSRQTTDVTRSARRAASERRLFLSLTLLVTVVVTVLIASSVGTTQVVYEVVEYPTEGERTLTVGESAVRTVELGGRAPPMSHRIVETRGMDTTEVEPTEVGLTVTVTIPPPEAATPTTKTVQVYHYPMVLPEKVVVVLHQLHPVAAAIATASAAMTPIALGYLVLVDGCTPPRTTVRRLRQYGWNR